MLSGPGEGAAQAWAGGVPGASSWWCCGPKVPVPAARQAPRGEPRSPPRRTPPHVPPRRPRRGAAWAVGLTVRGELHAQSCPDRALPGV